MLHQWQWFPGMPDISLWFRLAWKFNLKKPGDRRGGRGRALPSHTPEYYHLLDFCTRNVFHSWEQTLTRAAWGWGFNVSVLMNCPGEPSRCKMAREAIFSICMAGFVWVLWYYRPQISDGEIWLWQVSSDKKRGSAKHIKSWEITRLNNTLLYLFFPSLYSLWSEHSPEGTLSSVINGKTCWSQFHKPNYFLQKSIWNEKASDKNVSFLSLELRGIQSLHVNRVYIDCSHVFWNWCFLGGSARKHDPPPGPNCEILVSGKMFSNKNAVWVCMYIKGCGCV